MTVAPIAEDELARRYVSAKRAVIDHGFIDEIAWQAQVSTRGLTSQMFLREAAWVVLNAGMRESVVRQRFGQLQSVLIDFDPDAVWRRRRSLRPRALAVFGHARKIDAIFEIASRVRKFKNEELQSVLTDPEPFLRSLPYIGPVTWKHLAKNLGMPIAKPDRHLLRYTARAGRASVEQLCAEISTWVGEPVEIVDLVLWRWSLLYGSSCGLDCHPDAAVAPGH